jgi:hypothetical protein
MALLDEVEIRVRFPELKLGEFEVTSPRTPAYNCIAWAAGDDKRWWWPDSHYYWPDGIPRKRSLDVFIEVFRQLGYAPCQNTLLEPEKEKVAIFIGPTGTPTHAARQESNGKWTSKLGNSNDIQHVLEQIGGVRGSGYGQVAAVMERKIGN